jgi:hypothetical protein
MRKMLRGTTGENRPWRLIAGYHYDEPARGAQ